MTPPRLRAGDRVRFVSPASPPERAQVERGIELVSRWGLTVELGAHVFERHGHYLAGRDEHRLADLNDALRDPGVRAIFATRGGKGSYRIAHGLDFDAARRDPKPFVGFSDITLLHLALAKAGAAGAFHGPYAAWSDDYYGPESAEQLRRALMDPWAITIRRDPAESTARLTTEGIARGRLLGGSLAMIARAVGWCCPRFTESILLIEAVVDVQLGAIDSALVQLERSGCLDGVKGIAVGQFIRGGEGRPGKWSVIDVLRDRLEPLGVPVLGGLPIGHGPRPPTVPLGTDATLDASSGTLTIAPGVA
jgi:muramoyltetrapeptide carboxypeptidase